MSIRITTWNVNSVRLRADLLAQLVETAAPDVLCLQETKVEDSKFPHEAFNALGFTHSVIKGQKSYNGVAIFSRLPFAETANGIWCGRDDCRHVSARLEAGPEVHNFYVPAGGDIPDREQNDKFGHKLDFIAEMTDWSRDRKGDGVERVLVGDLNIAPLESDVWSHKQLLKVVSHTPVETEGLLGIIDAGGWVDAVRHLRGPDEKLYSWWSYRSRDWKVNDRGRRLDHVWVTPGLVPSLRQADILRDARDWVKPSDHVPVTVELDL